MQRAIISIPDDLMLVTSVDWDIDWRGQSASEKNSGATQVVYNAFPRWIGKPKFRLHRDQILYWRALRAQVQGRVGIYKMTLVDPIGFAMTDAYGTVDPAGIPFSDGAYFSDGTGYAYEALCSAAQDAAKGASLLRVQDCPATPRVGQIMSHNLWPFLVTSVTEVTTGVYDLGVQMPLREAISTGDEINLKAEGLFEAVSDLNGDLGYALNHTAYPSFEFREVLNR